MRICIAPQCADKEYVLRVFYELKRMNPVMKLTQRNHLWQWCHFTPLHNLSKTYTEQNDPDEQNEKDEQH